jgi:hypothetical protein
MAKDLDTRTLQALRTFDRLQFQERQVQQTRQRLEQEVSTIPQEDMAEYVNLTTAKERQYR